MIGSRSALPSPAPPWPTWQGSGQEPRGALGGTAVTSQWTGAREMGKAHSQQGGTLFDISSPNHIVSVLA